MMIPERLDTKYYICMYIRHKSMSVCIHVIVRGRVGYKASHTRHTAIDLAIWSDTHMSVSYICTQYSTSCLNLIINKGVLDIPSTDTTLAFSCVTVSSMYE